jgi:hypothetical protein
MALGLADRAIQHVLGKGTYWRIEHRARQRSEGPGSLVSDWAGLAVTIPLKRVKAHSHLYSGLPHPIPHAPLLTPLLSSCAFASLCLMGPSQCPPAIISLTVNVRGTRQVASMVEVAHLWNRGGDCLGISPTTGSHRHCDKSEELALSKGMAAGAQNATTWGHVARNSDFQWEARCLHSHVKAALCIHRKLRFKTPCGEPNKMQLQPDQLIRYQLTAPRWYPIFLHRQCLAHCRHSMKVCQLKSNWTNEWMDKKEGADGRDRGSRMDAQVSRCQAVGWASSRWPCCQAVHVIITCSCLVVKGRRNGYDPVNWAIHRVLRRHHNQKLSQQ